MSNVLENTYTYVVLDNVLFDILYLFLWYKTRLVFAAEVQYVRFERQVNI